MDDTIFRADAIALASGGCHPANLAEELAKLPSAQPEVAKDTNVPINDCISRQAVIDRVDRIVEVNHLCEDLVWFTPRGVKALLDELPTAHRPVDEWCVDCKEYDKERHCCPRFNRVIRTALDDADLVSVVRCGECVHGHRYFEAYGLDCLSCRKLVDKNGNGIEFPVLPDGYCSDGKRKDLSLPTDNTDRCVCCGEPVPEGRMVCPVCERRANE